MNFVRRFELSFMFAFALAAVSLSAQAQSPRRTKSSAVKAAPAPSATDVQMIEQSSRILSEAQNKIAIEMPGCPDCTTDAGEPTMPPSCIEAYKDFYAKPVLDFRITFGYSDHGLDVEDGPMRAAWVDKLLKPCPKNAVGICGFKLGATVCVDATGPDGQPKDDCQLDPMPDDRDLFSKTVEGPDGHQHAVNLHIVKSSVSSDDITNRGQLKALQAAETKRAEENFFGGLGSADLVIYVGHARNGGGPSFAPPIRSNDGISVNYKAYGLASEKRMLDTLKANTQPPKLLGLFACDADRWFSDQARQASKHRSGVVSSVGLTSPAFAETQAFSTLDSVLAMRCETEFVGAYSKLRRFTKTDRDPSMKGFFKVPGQQQVVEENPKTPSAVRAQTTDEALIHPAAKVVTIPETKKRKSVHSEAVK